jgi:formiminotetrahydrofolate cyclodeaminase
MGPVGCPPIDRTRLARGGRAGTALIPGGRPTIGGVASDHPLERFGDMSLSGFIDRLASADPVPGGGSASAVAGSVAAALVSMVTSLSTGRPKYEAHEALYEWTSVEGRHLSERLLALADEDAVAYGGFAAARKQPRDTDQERAARAAALQVAARVASEVPMLCLEACRDVVAAAEALAGRSNVNAASDVLVAVLLGEAAAGGAAANVRINLPAVGDDDFATELTERVDTFLHDVHRLAAQAREVVASGELREPLLEVAAS